MCIRDSDEADGTRVNLAMQLKDGDKIYIPYAYDDISLTDEINNGCNPNATGISGSNTENSGGNSESYGSNTGGCLLYTSFFIFKCFLLNC